MLAGSAQQVRMLCDFLRVPEADSLDCREHYDHGSSDFRFFAWWPWYSAELVHQFRPNSHARCYHIAPSPKKSFSKDRHGIPLM